MQLDRANTRNGALRALAILALLALLGGCYAEAGGGSGVVVPYTLTTPAGATAFTAAVYDEIDALPYRHPDASAWDALRFAVQQEKLGRDLFLLYYDVWGDVRFLDLYEAEASHRRALVWLLDKYGIADPVHGLPDGAYADLDLQWAWDDWSSAGAAHLTDALIIGATLMEWSIAELQAQSCLAVDTADVTFLYDMLLLASRNHLRMLVSWLAAHGIRYDPVYLPLAEYLDIIETPIERGH